MTDIWFQHLSSTLSENGLIAYIWDEKEDRFEWAGDMLFLFGTHKSEFPLSARDYNRLINPQHLPQRLAAIHELAVLIPVGEDSPQMRVEYKLRRANGLESQIEETACLYKAADGRVFIRGFLRVIADRNRAAGVTAGMQSCAFTDGSACHYGRVSVIQRIDEWRAQHMHSGKGNNSHGYLLVAGVDRLAMFNEAFGPRYTDELLEKVYQRFQLIVGKNGLVYRIDGDVFALFFPSASHNEMAAVGKYVISNFQDSPLQGGHGPVCMSVSIGGIYLDPVQDTDSANFLVKAEMAMRDAKDQGRGCYVSYVEAASRSRNNRLLISSGDQFLNALKNNRVQIAFQPIMNAGDRQVSFHECLIRLIDERGEMQSAAAFFPAIEKLGLSRLVDQFALRTAINELAQFPHLSLSVNVSPATLVNRSWLRGLVLALRDCPSIARRLIVEVTESAAIENPERIMLVVNTLRDLGCRIALDDFGAGYTAFSQLKNLDLDIVKIDKSFVRGISDQSNHLFIKTLQSLAEGVDVETVAEGAETMGEADLLALEGINYIQGYVYGFPQAERVWLPQEHARRQIYREGKEGLRRKNEISEEIMSLVTW